MNSNNKLKVWLDSPETPPNAWKMHTYPEIDKQAGVNPHNACVQLPKIIAERTGKTEAEVREMRMQYRYEHGLAKRRET